jgi:peptidyl-prolyl cis-trans isomerase SurA
MSFRNRPVLDRKHRPRWQDELRTQQLTVAGFALAIAVALGIFAAVAWSAFYNATLRQVALVHGEAVDRSDLRARTDLIAAELSAQYLDLSGQLGGARDQVIQQQLQSLQQAINAVEDIASDSLVTGLVMDARAAEFGLSVDDPAVDAALEERRTQPERMQLSLIQVRPEIDADAEPGSEPTDQDWADAAAEIDEVKARLDGGAEWDALAADHSDDATAAAGGLLGWITADDAAYGDYFDAVADAEAGAVVGPLQDDQGWYLLRVNERQAAGRNQQLDDLLAAAGVSDAAYRDYVRQNLLQTEFRDYFTNVVVGKYAPQQRVEQILIDADEEAGAPAPKVQIRHLLVQPLPDAQDQSEATEEQWAAALERARELRRAASRPDADWYELAKQSADPGSRTTGGSLGWHDLSTLGTAFVPEFAEAVQELDVGQVSEPVRSEFGYHIIEVTDRRVSALELANRLFGELEEDPDAFEQLARDYSEDPVTAASGGDLGWVIPYQLEEASQDAIFALTEPGQISEPLQTANGIYIFKLIESSDARFVPAKRREEVTGSGFSRWLNALKDQAGVWLDPELAPTTVDDSGGGGTTPIVP